MVGLVSAPHLNGKTGILGAVKLGSDPIRRIVFIGGDARPGEPLQAFKLDNIQLCIAPAAADNQLGDSQAAGVDAKARARNGDGISAADSDAMHDDGSGNLFGGGDNDEMEHNATLERVRDLLIEAVEALELPPNPLDYLIDLCGGPDKVAEMTGRVGHTVRNAEGKVGFAKRADTVESTIRLTNMAERDSFMQGRKCIALISDAASTGISLQADRRAENSRRRCHITLELPWSADKAIQQFGRSHRSNQSSAPVYRIVVTPCGGERRFVSSAAKRLQSLGALLRGDRRALGAGANLKAFDVDNRYGAAAVTRLYSDVAGVTSPMEGVRVPGEDVTAFRKVAAEGLAAVGIGSCTPQTGANQAPVYVLGTTPAERRKFEGKVGVFLNRMLGLPVATQKLLFDYFQAGRCELTRV